MNNVTTNELKHATRTAAKHFATKYQELNALDGKLGDGDIGITMKNGFEAALESSDDWPEDIGMALMAFAKSFVSIRASSFGTLFATGIMAAAMQCKGTSALITSDIAPILSKSLENMAKRGKSALGDKTVLDAVNAAYLASLKYKGDDFKKLGILIRQYVEHAVQEYTSKPNLQGRARMFGDKSIGIPDPGMQVFLEIVISLTEDQT